VAAVGIRKEQKNTIKKGQRPELGKEEKGKK
jgi:hypothetical protein